MLNEKEKLRLLLPHWLEHNQKHKLEFESWALALRQEGEIEAADLIVKAIAGMTTLDDNLAAALDKLGGAAKKAD